MSDAVVVGRCSFVGGHHGPQSEPDQTASGSIRSGRESKVELTNGKKFKGSIQSIEHGGFLLAAPKAGSPTRVPYGEVAQLNLAKNTYKATGQPDSVAVKRVVAELGVAHHIMVKTSEAKEYHGNIVAIEAESFTVLPDHTAAPVQIAYNNVQQMGPNMSKWGWIGIGMLAGIVVVVIVVYVALTTVHEQWFLRKMGNTPISSGCVSSPAGRS